MFSFEMLNEILRPELVGGGVCEKEKRFAGTLFTNNNYTF
jgi:hypothetical protein